ncbi:MAG: hypothetical protein MUO63_09125 [Desulfobulbaceae bacterium]|nr:hypothetical protein [Desulfobulbaceae bacterium]
MREPSGQVPCSGAKRRGKALDEVSTAIPGDAVAGNVELRGSQESGATAVSLAAG